MPLARMMLSSVQRCSAKRLVIAPPGSPAKAVPLASAALAPAADAMKLRRSMVVAPGSCLAQLYHVGRIALQPDISNASRKADPRQPAEPQRRRQHCRGTMI